MKPAPTLMDEVYRASMAKKTNPGWKDNALVRRALEKAKRFVVDEKMSTFMAELSNEAFIRAGVQNPLSHKIADSLRVQSRLPHPVIWIEYDLRAYQKRANEIRGTIPPDPSEIPMREGWLIMQHPFIETAMILHMWTQNGEDEPPDEQGYRLWTFPFAFGWCADDSPLPWWSSVITAPMTIDGVPASRAALSASSIIVGIGGYERDNVNCVVSPLIADPRRDPELLRSYNSLLGEWAGVVRRVWALLATINDLPTTVGEVRQSKGFLARGRIRKYLSHSTVTLNVPARKDTRVLARQMIAMAHRKRHNVRAHWRDDWRHPLSTQCKPHLWEAMDDNADTIQCSSCGGRQLFIHKHERGDATLGWVSHNYVVTHPTEEPA